MLHAAETWTMTVATPNHLPRNDHEMIRWICNVKVKYEVSSDSLFSKFGLQDIDVVLRSSRMRWYGHANAEVRKLNVVTQKRSGKPRKSRDDVLLDDRKNYSGLRGCLRRRLVKQVGLSSPQ